MRVLVATGKSNGREKGDYDFCVEGELVYVQEPCAGDLRDPEGPCGCGRGFAGMNSHRATTTALVVESPLGESEVRQALTASLEAGGWIVDGIPQQLADQLVEEAMGDLRQIASYFPVGSVVRRRLGVYRAM